MTGVRVITAGADELADAQTASALSGLHSFTLYRSLHEGAPHFHRAILQSDIVKDTLIRTMQQNGIDYVCITDIARQKNGGDPNGVIANWMRNRNTIEFLGIWEQLFNPSYTPLEFEGFRKEAGLNAFTMSPPRWIE